jgi:hypothetical protein
MGIPYNPGFRAVGHERKQAVKIIGLPISVFIYIFAGDILYN